MLAAADNESFDCIYFLLDMGVDIETKDDENSTILSKLCLNNQIDCVKQLILRGVDVNVKADDLDDMLMPKAGHH